MRNTLQLLLLGLLGSTGSLPAETPASSWTFTPAFVSQYIYRGVKAGGAALQPAIDFSRGNAALGLWANLPVQDKLPGVSDPEYDLYGSYTWVLDERASLVPGFASYHYPRAERADGFYRHTFEPSLALEVGLRGVRVIPKVYYDVVLDGATYELSAGWALPLSALGGELAFGGTIGRYSWAKSFEDTTPHVRNWGKYWQFDVTLPLQVSAHSEVTFTWAYARGSGNFYEQAGAPRERNPGAVGRGFIRVAYAYTW